MEFSVRGVGKGEWNIPGFHPSDVREKHPINFESNKDLCSGSMLQLGVHYIAVTLHSYSHA